VSAVILPPGADLVERVARLLEDPAADCSEAVVVFPGKRPAHFLRRRLARRRGAGFIPPRILSMDGLVDAAYEARAGEAALTLLEDIDAVALLYEIQIASETPLGDPTFMTLDSFYPLGLRIWSDCEELAIEKVQARSVAEVQTLVEEEVPPRARERLRSLAHFYEGIYAAVQERGLSTRSSRYRIVGEGIREADVPGTGPLVIAGVSTVTASERDLLLAMARWPRTVMVFQDGPGLRGRMAAVIAACGGAEEAAGPAAPVAAQARRTFFYDSPDAHGQVFALNAALAEPDDDTCIVLPRPDTLFPLLRHCLSRFDPESYNVSLPYPLRRTPLYGFLNDLMKVVGSMEGELVYLPDYVAFALHPYVKNVRLGASAESTRVMFHALEERLAGERGRRFAQLEEIESDTGLFDDAAARLDGGPDLARRLRGHLRAIHERTVSGFRSFRSVGDFAERCIALVSWIHDESTARDHPYFTPFSEAFVRSLEAIAGSLLAGKGFNDTASYFALLRRYLDACYLPFPGTPLHGMQVLGSLETRGLSFSRLFVLDANEGVFPAGGREGSLLPLAVRSALGLSTYRDREENAAHHFDLLAAGARELHLFSIASGESQRSRFVERLLWERQKETATRDESSLVLPIRYKASLATKPPSPVEKSPGMVEWLRGRRFSATSLGAYLACPLRFYNRTVLGLSPREEATGEVEAGDVGTFVHEALQRYLSPFVGRPLDADAADPGAMARAVDELFERRFGPAETGANRLLRDRVRGHLRDFVGSYLGPLARGHRIVVRALEHDASVPWRGFSLGGRIDAVIERDGRPCLVDWKTSANAAAYTIAYARLSAEDRASWSRAIPTLQLPFYTLLHAGETGREPTEIEALFLLLGRTDLGGGIEASMWNGREPAEAWPVLEAVIHGLLEEIVSPDAAFQPADDLETACPRCDFTGLCGTRWLVR
jgi:ATP-dependent helicase/nuclease subunit B